MTSMIERVARMICDVERQANGWPRLRPEETLESAGTKWYTEMARAALIALLEPSESMIVNGMVTPHIDPEDGQEYGLLLTTQQTEAVFIAMVRTALDEVE